MSGVHRHIWTTGWRNDTKSNLEVRVACVWACVWAEKRLKATSRMAEGDVHQWIAKSAVKNINDRLELQRRLTNAYMELKALRRVDHVVDQPASAGSTDAANCLGSQCKRVCTLSVRGLLGAARWRLSHLYPVAACWQWSTALSNISSELSERSAASATFLSPWPCPVEAPRRWHRPASHRPPYRPPGQKEEGQDVTWMGDQKGCFRMSMWARAISSLVWRL